MVDLHLVVVPRFDDARIRRRDVDLAELGEQLGLVALRISISQPRSSGMRRSGLVLTPAIRGCLTAALVYETGVVILPYQRMPTVEWPENPYCPPNAPKKFENVPRPARTNPKLKRVSEAIGIPDPSG